MLKRSQELGTKNSDVLSKHLEQLKGVTWVHLAAKILLCRRDDKCHDAAVTMVPFLVADSSATSNQQQHHANGRNTQTRNSSLIVSGGARTTRNAGGVRAGDHLVARGCVWLTTELT